MGQAIGNSHEPFGHAELLTTRQDLRTLRDAASLDGFEQLVNDAARVASREEGQEPSRECLSKRVEDGRRFQSLHVVGVRVRQPHDAAPVEYESSWHRQLP